MPAKKADVNVPLSTQISSLKEIAEKIENNAAIPMKQSLSITKYLNILIRSLDTKLAKEKTTSLKAAASVPRPVPVIPRPTPVAPKVAPRPVVPPVQPVNKEVKARKKVTIKSTRFTKNSTGDNK